MIAALLGSRGFVRCAISIKLQKHDSDDDLGTVIPANGKVSSESKGGTASAVNLSKLLLLLIKARF